MPLGSQHTGHARYVIFLICFTLYQMTKAFADGKLNVVQMMGFISEIVDMKHCGKGENAGCQHFLLFPQCFPKASQIGSLTLTLLNWYVLNIFN